MAKKAPATVLDVKDHLKEVLPEVDLDDACRPVALIARADGNAFSLSTDEDVESLFAGTAYVKVTIEIQELFPRANAKTKIVDFSQFLEISEPPQDEWSMSVEPSFAASTNAATKEKQNEAFLRKRGTVPPMAFGRRLNDRRRVCEGPPSENRDLKASSSKAEPQPQPRRARSCLGYRKQHEPRTGRKLDEKWSVEQGVKDEKLSASSRMLFEAGIKKDFEDLEAKTHERRQAMGRLLRPRWRAQQTDMVRPGLGSPAVTKLVANRDLGDPLVLGNMGQLKRDPVADNDSGFVEYALPALSGLQEMSLRSDDAFGQKEWLYDLGCVANRDVPPLMATLESLSQLQDDMRSRLQDQSQVATWHISGAYQSVSDDQALPSGGSHLGPRKTMIESPWMHLEKVGRVMFRLLPCGDGAAAPDHSTIFVWADTPPLMTFTIEVGGIECIAPRLWPQEQHHYRVEVPWRHVASALAAAEATDDCLAVTFKVLQLYGNLMGV